MVAVRFGLLGSFVVEDAEGTPRRIGTPKARALLAVLLLRGDSPVSWDTVKTAIWGESVPATARASLHNHVARLRRDLDESGDRIQVTPAGFRLRVLDDELDVTRFDRYLCRARTARLAEDWAAVEALTRSALALWRGAPLSDVPLPDTEREPVVRRLEEARLQVLEWGYEADLHLGRHQGIAAELAALVAAHPLRETFVGQLMLALHRSGRQADALLAYDTARRTIRRELGVDPEPGLVELHRRILTLDPALTAPRTSTAPQASAAPTAQRTPTPQPPTTPTPPLPEPPLPTPADLTDPPAATHPVPAPVPHQLPSSPADFTGREHELDRIVGELAAADRPDGATVLVHRVSGSGGMGKTTLMVRAAHQIRERFPDGQIFLDLGGMTAMPMPPESALGLLLRTLGVAPEEVPSGLQARSALFRSLIARRRMLILLDDAGDAAQIRPLLPGAAGSAVLVTSRRRLVSFPGVRIDLGALPDDAAHRLLASIVGEDRVAAQPSATAEVLRACGGMPLALRLAGSRLAARPAWSVQDLAHRLTSHGRVLRELYADDLHVRTALQMSYELLQESQERTGPARAFRLLGLMPGGAFGTAAAAALLDCDEMSVEDWLEALVDAHLLESLAPGRYQFHCLLRELARELAEETDTERERTRAVERLVEWCLRGADAATARVAPAGRRVPLEPAQRPPVSFTGYDEAYGWYERERETLVAAVSLAHETGLHAQSWKLAASLWAYLRLGGHHDDWLCTHTVGLAAARAAGDERAEAWMLNGLGNQVKQAGRPAEAITYFRRVLSLHEGRPGRDAELSAVLNNLGTCFTDLGDHEPALRHYRESLVWEPSSCATLNNMADALAHLDRHDEALDVLDRAEEIQRATCDRVSLAIGLRVRGDVLRGAGRPAEAVEAYRRALALQRLGGDQHSEAVSLTGLGDALAALGDRSEAETCWGKALHWMEHLGDEGRTVGLRRRLART